MATYTISTNLAQATTSSLNPGQYPLFTTSTAYAPETTIFCKPGDTTIEIISNPEHNSSSSPPIGVTYANADAKGAEPDPVVPPPFFQHSSSSASYSYTWPTNTTDFYTNWFFFGGPQWLDTSINIYGYKHSLKTVINCVKGTLTKTSGAATNVRQGGTLSFTVTNLAGLLQKSGSNGNFLYISIFNSSNQRITGTDLDWDDGGSDNGLGRIHTGDTTAVMTVSSTLATGTYTAYLTHYNSAHQLNGSTSVGNRFYGAEQRMSSVTFQVLAGVVGNLNLGADVDPATNNQTYTFNSSRGVTNSSPLSIDPSGFTPFVSISGTGSGNNAAFKRLNADDIYMDSTWQTSSGVLTVQNGWTVDVRLTAPSGQGTNTATLTIGGTSDTIAVTTPPDDTTPDEFNSTLTDNTDNDFIDEAKETFIYSNIMTLSGTNQDADVSTTVLKGTGLNLAFRKRADSGSSWSAWAGSGTLEPGYQWQFRIKTSANFDTENDGRITIGGVEGEITTKTIVNPGSGTGSGGSSVTSGNRTYGIQVFNGSNNQIYGINMRSSNIVASGTIAVNGNANSSYIQGIEGMTATNDGELLIFLAKPRGQAAAFTTPFYFMGLTIVDRGTEKFRINNTNSVALYVDYYVVRF